MFDSFPTNCATLPDGLQTFGSVTYACYQHATTTAFNYLNATSSSGLITSVANQLLEGVFVFVRFILPYSIVIGLLMVGLGIVWRVFRGVGKV